MPRNICKTECHAPHKVRPQHSGPSSPCSEALPAGSDYTYSEALATTAVTKDRVLGHNPVAALYTADSYYSKLKKSEEE